MSAGHLAELLHPTRRRPWARVEPRALEQGVRLAELERVQEKLALGLPAEARSELLRRRDELLAALKREAARP